MVDLLIDGKTTPEHAREITRWATAKSASTGMTHQRRRVVHRVTFTGLLWLYGKLGALDLSERAITTGLTQRSRRAHGVRISGQQDPGTPRLSHAPLFVGKDVSPHSHLVKRNFDVKT